MTFDNRVNVLRWIRSTLCNEYAANTEDMVERVIEIISSIEVSLQEMIQEVTDSNERIDRLQSRKRRFENYIDQSPKIILKTDQLISDFKKDKIELEDYKPLWHGEINALEGFSEACTRLKKCMASLKDVLNNLANETEEEIKELSERVNELGQKVQSQEELLNFWKEYLEKINKNPKP